MNWRNRCAYRPSKKATTDDVPKNIAKKKLRKNATCCVEACIVGQNKEQDKQIGVKIEAIAYRDLYDNATILDQQSYTLVAKSPGAEAMTAKLVTVGPYLKAQVTGLNGVTIEWQADIELIVCTPRICLTVDDDDEGEMEDDD